MARRLRHLIGFTPVRLQLFKLAFFHKSTFASKDYAIANNERLEFLGDAVLSTIVGEYLFKKYPNSDNQNFRQIYKKISNARIKHGAHYDINQISETEFDELMKIALPDIYANNKKLCDDYKTWLYLF